MLICIELNAHALVVFLMTIRDNFFTGAFLFAPWKLGSQSCEKIFRSALSMTNTFSTIINFSLLGLMRRLHRLQVQSNLQAQSDLSGIAYPQVNKHRLKDGTNSNIGYPIDGISNKDISEAILQANLAAKTTIESLGMDELLKEHKLFCDLPVPGTDLGTDILSDCDSDADSDLESNVEVENPGEALINATVLESSIECASDIETDITALAGSDIIDSGVKQNLTTLKQSFSQFKKSYSNIYFGTT